MLALAAGWIEVNRGGSRWSVNVAVLITGLWRTGSKCWPRWESYFKAYNADVHYLSHEPMVVPGITVHVTPDDPQDEHNYSTNLGLGSKSLQSQLRALNDLRYLSRIVRESSKSYDWVFRLRPDLHLITFPESLESIKSYGLWIPTHDNWSVVPSLPGYCDKFYFGQPSDMYAVMERYDRLPTFWNECHVFHMETFMAWTCSAWPMHRTRTTFGQMRENGEYTPPHRRLNYGDTPAIEVCA
jgi:hypothetical protein